MNQNDWVYNMVEMCLFGVYMWPQCKQCASVEGQGDRWRNIGVIQQYKSYPSKPDQCQWCFFFLLIYFYIHWEYRWGEYEHVTTPDRITVSIRVQSVRCLSCHTSWQDKWRHCKWELNDKLGWRWLGHSREETENTHFHYKCLLSNSTHTDTAPHTYTVVLWLSIVSLC